MSDVKCARLMYRAAERDVLTLRSMTAGAPMESFGFHVQQAAEKAFKAWLALLGETYPLTHSIETLLDLLDDRGAAVEPFRNLVDYTPYAVEFRYVGVDPDAEPIDREGAIATRRGACGAGRAPVGGGREVVIKWPMASSWGHSDEVGPSMPRRAHLTPSRQLAAYLGLEDIPWATRPTDLAKHPSGRNRGCRRYFSKLDYGPKPDCAVLLKLRILPAFKVMFSSDEASIGKIGIDSG